MKNKNDRSDKGRSNTTSEVKSSGKESSLKDILLIVFVIISLCLALTQYLYYKINSKNQSHVSMNRDVHRLISTLHPFKSNQAEMLTLEGSVKIESMNDNIHVFGEVKGLTAGSIHAIHILEYTDIMMYKDETDKKKLSTVSKDLLRHYNPLRVKHSCPVIDSKISYHMGDLGNLIANSEGKANFSIIKKGTLKGLVGRLLVIKTNKDDCDEKTEFDKIEEILALGTFSVLKPQLTKNQLSEKDDFFMREINTFNKNEFDRSRRLNSEREEKEKNKGLIKDDKKEVTNSRKIEKPGNVSEPILNDHDDEKFDKEVIESLSKNEKEIQNQNNRSNLRKEVSTDSPRENSLLDRLKNSVDSEELNSDNQKQGLKDAIPVPMNGGDDNSDELPDFSSVDTSSRKSQGINSKISNDLKVSEEKSKKILFAPQSEKSNYPQTITFPVNLKSDDGSRSILQRTPILLQDDASIPQEISFPMKREKKPNERIEFTPIKRSDESFFNSNTPISKEPKKHNDDLSYDVSNVKIKPFNAGDRDNEKLMNLKKKVQEEKKQKEKEDKEISDAIKRESEEEQRIRKNLKDIEEKKKRALEEKEEKLNEIKMRQRRKQMDEEFEKREREIKAKEEKELKELKAVKEMKEKELREFKEIRERELKEIKDIKEREIKQHKFEEEKARMEKEIFDHEKSLIRKEREQEEQRKQRKKDREEEELKKNFENLYAQKVIDTTLGLSDQNKEEKTKKKNEDLFYDGAKKTERPKKKISMKWEELPEVDFNGQDADPPHSEHSEEKVNKKNKDKSKKKQSKDKSIKKKDLKKQEDKSISELPNRNLEDIPKEEDIKASFLSFPGLNQIKKKDENGPKNKKFTNNFFGDSDDANDFNNEPNNVKLIDSDKEENGQDENDEEDEDDSEPTEPKMASPFFEIEDPFNGNEHRFLDNSVSPNFGFFKTKPLAKPNHTKKDKEIIEKVHNGLLPPITEGFSFKNLDPTLISTLLPENRLKPKPAPNVFDKLFNKSPFNDSKFKETGSSLNGLNIMNNFENLEPINNLIKSKEKGPLQINKRNKLDDIFSMYKFKENNLGDQYLDEVKKSLRGEGMLGGVFKKKETLNPSKNTKKQAGAKSDNKQNKSNPKKAKITSKKDSKAQLNPISSKPIIRSETANKLLNEMNKNDSYLKKLEKSDNTKLFLNDFKKSIDKIDAFSLH